MVLLAYISGRYSFKAQMLDSKDKADARPPSIAFVRFMILSHVHESQKSSPSEYIVVSANTEPESQ